jgi:hypothetical protein
MKVTPSGAVAVLMLCFSTFLFSPGRAEPSAGEKIRPINLQRLAKVVPGITKARVKSLLGEPWRTIQYNDLDKIENEIWEYRGKDAQGEYRIHIEFNREDMVVIVGKIPEHAPMGSGAATDPGATAAGAV